MVSKFYSRGEIRKWMDMLPDFSEKKKLCFSSSTVYGYHEFMRRWGEQKQVSYARRRSAWRNLHQKVDVRT